MLTGRASNLIFSLLAYEKRSYWELKYLGFELVFCMSHLFLLSVGKKGRFVFSCDADWLWAFPDVFSYLPFLVVVVVVRSLREAFLLVGRVMGACNRNVGIDNGTAGVGLDVVFRICNAVLELFDEACCVLTDFSFLNRWSLYTEVQETWTPSTDRGGEYK